MTKVDSRYCLSDWRELPLFSCSEKEVKWTGPVKDKNAAIGIAAEMGKEIGVDLAPAVMDDKVSVMVLPSCGFYVVGVENCSLIVFAAMGRQMVTSKSVELLDVIARENFCDEICFSTKLAGVMRLAMRFGFVLDTRKPNEKGFYYGVKPIKRNNQH